MNPQYLPGQVEQALASDPRTHELGVRAVVEGDTLVVMGEVGSTQRLRMVEEVIAEVAPDISLRNEVSVTQVGKP
jgi:hypothetical protein